VPPISALAALPVLVAIYVVATMRQARTARSPLLVATLVVASLTGAAAGGDPLDAGAPTASPTLAPEAFRPVAPPVADDPREIAQSSTPSPSAPASEAAAATPTPSPPEPPSVVRFRPRNGWTGVSRFADVSVRFSAPMDRAATQAAFHATIGASTVAGRFRWAEGDTVLVLNPGAALPYGATVALSVDAGAISVEGAPLEAPARVAFVVESKPRPRPAPSPTPKEPAWQWPLIGPITQLFGQSLTQYGFHQGIDIDGDTGDPVRAARSGRVIVAGYADSCGGLQVRIDHGNGYTSWYRHLSRVTVAVGERVSGGTLIGRVGATGCAIGSHLHFGIRKGSTFVDPLKYLPRR
jgi:murein DD-endopeptidase MepM/ murein hydrolase activator NlpD